MNKRPFRTIAWIALFSVICHAMLPLLHAVSQPRGFMATLCSVGNPGRQVFIAFDGTPEPAPVKDLQARCPLCLAGAHFALTPPANALSMLLSSMVHIQLPARANSDYQSLLWPDFHPRAPPEA